MLILFCFLAGFISLVIFFLVWFAIKGLPRQDDSLVGAFNALLEKNTSASFIVIQKVFKKEFIQFYRYLDKFGNPNIMMSFPIADWSSKYKDKLLELLEAEGLKHEIDTQANMHFIEIDCGSEARKAEKCARLVLRNVFSFSANAIYYVSVEM